MGSNADNMDGAMSVGVAPLLGEIDALNIFTTVIGFELAEAGASDDCIS